MTVTRDLSATVTGTSGIIRSITTEESYSNISATAIVEADSTTLSLGDSVTITLGYVGNTAQVFSGVAKKIDRIRPDNVYRITCNDILVRAVDFFLAADDPEHPFQRNNIGTLQLVKDLLAECGITNVQGDDKPFTWGTNEDGARFNLQSVADAVSFIAQIVGSTIYADSAGVVQFRDRKPYVDVGDTPTQFFTTGNSGNIISISYQKGTGKTRNLIQVYGRDNLRARRRADNPNLVVDQAVVIAHELLDTQALCDGTAEVNLTLLNRLEETYEMEIEGNPNIAARQIGDITESFTGASGRDVFLYRVSHIFSEGGPYITAITATP